MGRGEEGGSRNNWALICVCSHLGSNTYVFTLGPNATAHNTYLLNFQTQTVGYQKAQNGFTHKSQSPQISNSLTALFTPCLLSLSSLSSLSVRSLCALLCSLARSSGMGFVIAANLASIFVLHQLTPKRVFSFFH